MDGRHRTKFSPLYLFPSFRQSTALFYEFDNSKDTESIFPDRKADANEYFRSIRINQRFSLMVADTFERLVNAKNQKPMHGTNQLQWGPVQEITAKGIANACYGPPPAFCPEMDPVEWLETMEDFFYVTGVPSSHQAASARLSVDDAARKELFPLGAPRDIS
ncbi:hypothetical protein T11_6593 [Trichinella zimbabwensis]|uniref:Uncharacterized protein n=1 Tax=Trichinella zimbabwensis TaxID=268475 RepID=A0A0V1I9E0_9BILA|nr:hypothetical protein T11_6593 [Trichinella zimbabwensis]